MGYVFPESTVAALEDINSSDPEKRRKAIARIEQGLQGYESYRDGMRSGIFGKMIGKALFGPTSRRP